MITLRPTTSNDCDLLYTWVNDPVTRESYFNQEEIPYEIHKSWFMRFNLDHIFLFSDENKNDVGVLRFENKNSEWIISLNIAPDHRNKGYASQIFSLASPEFLKRNPNISMLYAYIKEENIFVQKAILKAGYKYIKTIEYNGAICRQYQYMKK